MRALRIDYAAIAPAQDGPGLADGSVRIPARIARTGVQVYTYDDGTSVREYRPPAEVFAADSLRAWAGLALTEGHPVDPVTPDNWRGVAVGHVSDTVGIDGGFIKADLVVKSADTLRKIADGELVELSCGYFAEVEFTPGVTPEGEHYDTIQRHIVGNHVALGPKGWGRAGENVKLFAGDSKDPTRARTAVSYHTNKEQNMTIKADNATPAPGTVETKVVPLAQYEQVAAERDALTVKLAQLETATVQADSRVADRVALRLSAVKVDSKIPLLTKDSAGKDVLTSDRDVMVATIVSQDPAFKADGRSDEYIRARFDIACENAAKGGAERTDDAGKTNLQALNTALAGTVTKTDGGQEEGAIAKARREMSARNNGTAKGAN